MPPATRTKTATQQALRFHGDTEETGTNGTFPKALGGPLSGLGTINALGTVDFRRTVPIPGGRLRTLRFAADPLDNPHP
jgi:hypothetical protein